MKLEMRRALARESYEEKICKVGQLIALARTFPRRTPARSRPSAPLILSESKIPYGTAKYANHAKGRARHSVRAAEIAPRPTRRPPRPRRSGCR